MKVLYFGPITPKGHASLGGYAAANRKNIDKLEEYGVDVKEFPKKTIVGLFFQPFKLFKYSGEKDIVIHVATPLGGLFMLPVLFLLIVSRLLKFPLLLDIRAGIFIQRYKKYNWFLKRLTKLVLDLASNLSVEGYSYIRDIKEFIGYKKTIHYFPNTVDCLSIRFREKRMDFVNLFYFGRVTSAKGIDIMLKMMELLGEKYCLYLAGPIAVDIDSNSLSKKNVKYLGILSADELKIQMEKMHYFIFPTKHEGEGQSNSLIESMSYGLVPVTSDQGFCKEVVSDCGRVLSNDSQALDYVNAIHDIEKEGFEQLSRKCIAHILDCHNLDAEVKKIIAVYQSMLSMN